MLWSTPEKMREYDLIISIGKTIQYALALSIPVYEYDYFGGCGYITINNIKAEEETNFSGRTTHKKMNSTEIMEDILNGWESQLAQLSSLREYADNNYRLSKIVNEQLALIDAAPIKHVKMGIKEHIFNDVCCAFYENDKVYAGELAQHRAQSQIAITELQRTQNEYASTVARYEKLLTEKQNELDCQEQNFASLNDKYNQISSLSRHCDRYITENFPCMRGVCKFGYKSLK